MGSSFLKEVVKYEVNGARGVNHTCERAKQAHYDLFHAHVGL